MMQGRARAADFVDQRFAAELELVVIGRPERRIRRARKNDVGDFEVIDRAVVRGRDGADFLRDAQRGLARFVRRSDVADDRRVNRVAGNDERIITDPCALRAREPTRNDDERIRRADEETELLQGADLVPRLRNRAFQFPFAVRGSWS